MTTNRKEYMKEYRKKNKEKLVKQAKVRRLRNKDRLKKQQKVWLKNHPDYYKTRKRARDYDPEAKMMETIRWKTIGQFKHLKENGCCEECGNKKDLQFHHLEPYAYDNFRILCRKCHHKVHEKIIIEMENTTSNKGGRRNE